MINYKLIVRMTSRILLLVSFFIALMIPVALFYNERLAFLGFARTLLIVSVFIFFGIFFTRKITNKELSIKGGFIFVTLSWIVIAAVGALPFIMSKSIPNFTDAYFETMSGLTTTGATILIDIEALPKSMLLWRATTHWLGGMGIVVLTVAILPLLGVDGFRLIKAEAPGPATDRLSSRITKTAKYLWGIYVALSVIQIILLMIFGMDFVDSVSHTFATMATGGFSTKNLSIAYYASPAIQYTITIFMIMAGINFSLYFRLLSGHPNIFFKDTELHYYIIIFLTTTLLITFNLYGSGIYKTAEEAFRHASFQSASILTTTGFGTADYELWGNFSQYIIFLLMFIGGCAGSTGGGIKVMRIIMLMKQSFAEIKRLVYPHAIFSVRFNNKPVAISLIHNILGFVILYIVSLLLIALVVSSGGHDIITSFTTALATLGNIGPGFGLVGPTKNYAFFQPYIKWFLSFAMMLGRLEIYTVIVLIFPSFWRKYGTI